jgi:hypothetical protein
MDGVMQISVLKIFIILVNVFTIGGLTKVLTLIKPILSSNEHSKLRKEVRDWFITIEAVIGIGCIILFLKIG